ncbi:MAG: hypothetical protein R3C14_23720 [Caldilineaceae bacterium]
MNESSNDTSNNDSSSEVTPRPPSQLFTVRIWAEASAQGGVKWRGKVQHVPGGAWRYFQDWEVLSAFLQTQVEAAVAITPSTASPSAPTEND